MVGRDAPQRLQRIVLLQGFRELGDALGGVGAIAAPVDPAELVVVQAASEHVNQKLALPAAADSNK